MAMRTERSKALHNFTMPPNLRWGNQRFLRCMKVNSDAQVSRLHRFIADVSCSSSDQRHRNNSVRGREKAGSIAEILDGSHKVAPTLPSDERRRFSGDDDGIAAIREKVMIDLQAEADKMKYAIFKDGQVSSSPPQPPAGDAAEVEVHRPWNLRTRRAACKSPASTDGGVAVDSGDKDGANGRGSMVDLAKLNSPISLMKPGLTAVADNSPRQRRDGDEKKERAKFSVLLSKSEIEEDYLEMVGHRPPRRPKKRPRTIQRQLDSLFPGLWLTEVTPDMYKVSEAGS